MHGAPPILSGKRHHEAPVFTPENLLREARRQLSVPEGAVAPVCVLDPDGDILRYLSKNGRTKANPHWACFHTTLYDFVIDGLAFSIIGCAVGASFAVLLPAPRRNALLTGDKNRRGETGQYQRPLV